jgi:hypothetical protein
MKSIAWSAAFVSLFLCAGRLLGQTVIHQDATIDYVVNDGLRVVDGATVEIVTNGEVFERTEIFDNSTLNVTGTGAPLSIHAYDTSVVNYTSSYSTNISAYDSSTVIHSVAHLPHGEVNSLQAAGMSTVHLVESRGHYWMASESSTVHITGGHVDFLQSYDTSLVNILSGDFDPSAHGASRINIFGGTIGSLSAGFSESDTSTIVVHGSGFNYPLGQILDPAGTLTGTLANGDPIAADFQIMGASSILLVPEPGSLTILVIVCGLLAARRNSNPHYIHSDVRGKSIHNVGHLAVGHHARKAFLQCMLK